MNLKKIEKEVVWWNRAAVILPIISTVTLFLLYKLDLSELPVLFYIALSLYVVTAITWWWWTMKNIVHLASLLTKTTKDIQLVIDEVKDMRNNINKSQNDVDNNRL